MKVVSSPYLTAHETAAITDYVTQIHLAYPNQILAVILFGSKARGNSDVESDIDLLVLVDNETGHIRSQLWRLAFELSLNYNLVLSPRVFSQTRWAAMEQLQPPLYRAITDDGILLTPQSIPV